MNVLVVEPDPIFGATLNALLAEGNHRALVVASAARALAAALREDFDLIIVDIQLPDMNGEELIRALKAQAPQLPVIVITRASPAVWQKVCEDAGAAVFLTKPLDVKIFRWEVAQVAKARLALRVGLVEPDPIGARRLVRALASLGCSVVHHHNAAAALAAPPPDPPLSLWVIDAADPQILGLLAQLRGGRAPAFCVGATAEQEEGLMRAGAALILSRPLDIDTLLTQASFMAQ